MAGSQLKNLKAALKAHGLTGQSNIKKNKKNSKRQAKEYDREEKAKILAKIREDFNPFEVKASKNKKNNMVKNEKDKMVAVGKPGISKQIGEEQRKVALEMKNSTKNRTGAFMDKRFGEKNKHMTEEEKMLERFTKERQAQSKKKQNLFNLDEDEDEGFGNDMFGNSLTHMGKSLGFDSGDLGVGSDNDGDGLKRSLDGGALGDDLGPARKKTKAEVMKEVIAKSKFYKHERQKAHEKMEVQIDDLDDNFDDIMSELRGVQVEKKDNNEEKPTVDKDYDVKVKELLMEKRAVPTDRTKTEEEILTEQEIQKKKLEQQRLDRMNGIVENEEGEERGVEDLDNDFWGSEEEDEMGEDNESIADSDDDIKFENDSDEEGHKSVSTTCPSSHKQLLLHFDKFKLEEQPKLIRKIVKATQPKLAEGNKERLGRFTGILLRHILFLADQNYSKDIATFKEVQNSLISVLKTLSEKYNRDLSETCREITTEIHERFKSRSMTKIKISDLIFFSIIGMIYSTSDQYHLVVTPCSVVMAEMLEQLKFNSIDRLLFGATLSKIILKYQRLSKRLVPELLYFVEKALTSLLPEHENIQIRVDSNELALPNDTKLDGFISESIQLHRIFEENRSEESNAELQKTLLLNLLGTINMAITDIWKNFSAYQELMLSLTPILECYVEQFPELTLSSQILDKIKKLSKFNEHLPLTLQDHKPASIPSHAPKFEESFNPDKKSYDPDRTRSEINKMKAQVKKERKFMLKEMRKDTRFEARQRINQQKKSSEEYHAKMARIINTISTEEGAEKNKYEREKKLRNSKK
ncbi:hypothetical protein Kpol_461p16 [Vanderwaltozyma polyspora DSM 70294]|uniref:Nucleolar complex protein 14 n=1 Tax=Vanderwaltozyma polyspora (strain ATCC 22028 / DSM 70294 / BCRC 21397 / CBS 2163 / NBRC 10782 / NRRL Y-8283 / UCD 57-17) TaxID=436907 RepID=A7TR52_VANPO|nr:uncharacterized protein Kpol_461p16 [Vanderwaltozyma polyspora DSM 70294]EDO15262.1 hypothetical protein Kpol_461p16 [Vanderwaltozyma polyspora DSM 70294]